MGIFDKFKAALGSVPQELEDTELVYVFLPAPFQPIERGERFEDPIDDELRLAGLGCVSGGGSALSDERPDGTRVVETCGIDVEATDLQAALKLLHEHLPQLGCPRGTQLHYQIADEPLQDEYDGSDWSVAKPRVAMHLGSGIYIGVDHPH